MLGANPGEPVLPLAKVASGGELARTMLGGLGLAGRRTAVGRHRQRRRTRIDPRLRRGRRRHRRRSGGGGGPALAALGAQHQVLVVTHLPQVAAFADHHLVVRKQTSTASAPSPTGPSGRRPGRAGSRAVPDALGAAPTARAARLHAVELLARQGASGRSMARCRSAE